MTTPMAMKALSYEVDRIGRRKSAAFNTNISYKEGEGGAVSAADTRSLAPEPTVT